MSIVLAEERKSASCPTTNKERVETVLHDPDLLRRTS
jgi:hypothetical protein